MHPPPIHQYTTLTSGAEAQNTFHVTHSRAFYLAAKYYNGGSIPASNKLEDGCCTRCYASDIANRLTGWVLTPTGCPL